MNGWIWTSDGVIIKCSCPFSKEKEAKQWLEQCFHRSLRIGPINSPDLIGNCNQWWQLADIRWDQANQWSRSDCQLQSAVAVGRYAMGSGRAICWSLILVDHNRRCHEAKTEPHNKRCANHWYRGIAVSHAIWLISSPLRYVTTILQTRWKYKHCCIRFEICRKAILMYFHIFHYHMKYKGKPWN